MTDIGEEPQFDIRLLLLRFHLPAQQEVGSDRPDDQSDDQQRTDCIEQNDPIHNSLTA
jgi:hypothetical protein